MQINLLILQLAVIFLPGIIWARLDAGFAAKVKPSDIEFFLRAFLFGLATYAAEFLLFTALACPSPWPISGTPRPRRLFPRTWPWR
jgi:hypothetical protein